MTKDELILKIFHDLEKDIINGVYPINSKIPSERELSIKYNATRIVIREAMAMLTQSGMVETRPQSGTFIKDFYRDSSLDTLVNVISVSNNIDVKIVQSVIRFFINNDIEITGRAAEIISADSLKKIEAQILKKKLHDDLYIQAECDFEIYYETVKASNDPLTIAIAVSIKPLWITALSMIYNTFDKKIQVIEKIIESDIILFKALSSHNSKKSMDALKMKISYFEDIAMKIEKIENGKMYIPRR